MAYLAGKGNVVTVLHVVRDLSGVAQTGESANVTTALFDPDGASSAISVTVTEIGTTGFYSVTFTPDETGNWLLRVTNPAPPDADGSTSDYVVDVQGATVEAAATLLLTTRVRVKERLSITVATHDDLIDSLISEVSDDIHSRCNRIFPEQTYTEYFHGMKGTHLHLRQGPLASVTSVNAVEYTGTDTRSETLTEVKQGDRLEGGLRSENHRGLGWIELISSSWTSGQRNYKVVYVAGYSTVPESLVSIATTYATILFNQRQSSGLNSKSLGDADQNLLTPNQVEGWLDRALRPWKHWGFA